MQIGLPRLWPRRPPAPPGPRESWSIEVQIHPSDIRRRVRYLFLSRSEVTLGSALVLVYLLFLALAAAVAPGVIQGKLNRQEYYALVVERERRGDRLKGLVGRMEQLEERSGALDLRMNKIFLAYDLPLTPGRGQGGYPFPAAAAESIYSGAIQRGNRLQAGVGERLGVLDTFLRQVGQFERAHPDQVMATPSISPLRGSQFVLTSSFGRRRSPFTKEMETHAGLDFAAPQGTPVYATGDGVVAFAGSYPPSQGAGWWRYGNLVLVENGDRFVTAFGHCGTLSVRSGQRVRRGDLLGTVGNTGWSTSPHLHYEVRRKGANGGYRPVDPLVYILDHRWPNEERLLARARGGTGLEDFEPLPPRIGK
jgi:murein DD-endopeptidase MepM/ murein hydrolase activator NlpD